MLKPTVCLIRRDTLRCLSNHYRWEVFTWTTIGLYVGSETRNLQTSKLNRKTMSISYIVLKGYPANNVRVFVTQNRQQKITTVYEQLA